MNKILLAIVFLIFIDIDFVQSQTIINKEDKFLNFGLGSGVGPYLGIDIGFRKNLTFGANLGANFYYDIGIYVIARADYHLNEKLALPEKYDLYAGLATGTLNNFLLTAQIGIKYKYNDMWDLNVEIGGGTHFFGRLGVSKKIFLQY